MKYIDNDFCYCANSIYEGDGKQCINITCPRHIANMPTLKEGEALISTWSYLKDAPECYYGYIQEVE